MHGYRNYEPFKLNDDFLSKYSSTTPPWGYGDLSWVTYKRTYARKLKKSYLFPDRPEETDEREQWWQTCQRVIEGVKTIQKIHCGQRGLPWEPEKARRHARDMYDRLFNFKWTPPGRGLWQMGTDFIFERTGAPLQNCGFYSTKDIDDDFAEPFCWAFEMSMLGVGVGFDTRGAGKVHIQEPEIGGDVHVIEDSREGWRDALRRLLNAFVGETNLPSGWDYSEIRPKGAPIKSFGGVASGPDPLEEMIETLEDLYRDHIGQPIDSEVIVDTMNIAGKCVVSGGVRRCMPEGTRVMTDRGFVPIEDVDISDKVMTKEGLKLVVDKVDQGEQDIVRINHQDGYLECTPDHRVAVLQEADGTHTWKEAENLSPGDRLAFFRHTSPGKNTSLPEWSYDKPKKSTTSFDIEIPDLDEQMAWFLGAFAADGYVRVSRNETKGEISLACNDDDQENIIRSKEALSRFGVNVSVKDYKHDGATRVNVNSNQLGLYFQEHVKKPNEEIRVPKYIREATPEIRRAYVAGVMDCDGCLTNRPMKVVDTIWEEFARDIQSLLYSLGIESRLHSYGNPDSRKESWSELYGVSLISMKSQNRVLSEFPLAKTIEKNPSKAQNSNGFPADMVQKLGGYSGNWSPSCSQMNTDCYERIHGETDVVPVEVEGVEEAGSDKTYDISVEGEHCFLAEGVLVHNTAQVALGEPSNEQYLDLKQDSEKVQEYRWASNNSVFAEVGMDYSDVAKRTAENGEPGYFWMKNAQKYGRMKDSADYQEDGIGLNPCCEMILQSGECCTLVESYPAHHDDIGDLLETLKAAYQYGKTVTLVNTHYEKTNQVMQKNRRIGCSMTGIVQAINKHGYRNFIQMCDEGYEYIQHLDKQYSDWLGVPRSVRTTTVKPSGTVSTLSGSTPGVHWGHAPYYIRRIRVQDTSDLVDRCRKAGYPVENDTYADNTYVIEFPVKAENMERGKAEVSLREKVALAARMQAEWSDNGVSCTAEFDPETEADEIPRLLEEYEDKLKAISFLPSEDHGYNQMPYEEISKEEYERRISEIDPISGKVDVDHDREDKFCSGEACKVDPD